MIFEYERQLPIIDVSEKILFRVLKRLKSYGPSSFASLADETGSYLQVAGGGVTCMLERKDMPSGKQYRGYQDKPCNTFPDGTLLVFSGGEIPLKNDEWFNIDQVTIVFGAFLKGASMPSFVKWRNITEIVR